MKNQSQGPSREDGQNSQGRQAQQVYQQETFQVHSWIKKPSCTNLKGGSDQQIVYPAQFQQQNNSNTHTYNADESIDHYDDTECFDKSHPEEKYRFGSPIQPKAVFQIQRFGYQEAKFLRQRELQKSIESEKGTAGNVSPFNETFMQSPVKKRPHQVADDILNVPLENNALNQILGPTNIARMKVRRGPGRPPKVDREKYMTMQKIHEETINSNFDNQVQQVSVNKGGEIIFGTVQQVVIQNDNVFQETAVNCQYNKFLQRKDQLKEGLLQMLLSKQLPSQSWTKSQKGAIKQDNNNQQKQFVPDPSLISLVEGKSGQQIKEDLKKIQKESFQAFKNYALRTNQDDSQTKSYYNSMTSNMVEQYKSWKTLNPIIEKSNKQRNSLDEFRNLIAIKKDEKLNLTNKKLLLATDLSEAVKFQAPIPFNNRIKKQFSHQNKNTQHLKDQEDYQLLEQDLADELVNPTIFQEKFLSLINQNLQTQGKEQISSASFLEQIKMFDSADLQQMLKLNNFSNERLQVEQNSKKRKRPSRPSRPQVKRKSLFREHSLMLGEDVNQNCQQNSYAIGTLNKAKLQKCFSGDELDSQRQVKQSKNHQQNRQSQSKKTPQIEDCNNNSSEDMEMSQSSQSQQEFEDSQNNH
eukprot:403354697